MSADDTGWLVKEEEKDWRDSLLRFELVRMIP